MIGVNLLDAFYCIAGFSTSFLGEDSHGFLQSRKAVENSRGVTKHSPNNSPCAYTRILGVEAVDIDKGVQR